MTIETFGIKAVKFVDRVTDLIAEILFIAALVVAGYALWDSNQVYNEASSANYRAYRPNFFAENPEEEAEEGTIGFGELVRMNPDVFGWITVNDTPIDYPVVQGSNNTRYVNYNAEGKYSLSGAIFLDYRNSRDFSDFNNILYGHHMEKKMMFGSLTDFKDKAYFDAHPYGNLYTHGVNHGIVFYALVLTEAYDKTVFSPGIGDEAKKQSYIDYVREHATLLREDIPVSVDDHLIILSTCTSEITNGRYLLVGKFDGEDHLMPLEEEVVEEESDTPAPRVVRRGKGIDRQTDVLSLIPLWGWVLIIWAWFGLIAILYFAWLVHRKGKSKES